MTNSMYDQLHVMTQSMHSLAPSRRPITLLFAAAAAAASAVAVVIGLLVIWAAMDPPVNELWTLAGLLAASAALTLLAYLALTALLPRRPLSGPGGRVVLVVLFSGVLALVNVLITAGFMFISSHDLTLLAALILFALLMSSLLALVVSRSISLPIQQLAAAVDRVDEHTLPVDLPIHGHDEIARLAGAFNSMGERLRLAAGERRRAETKRLELVAAISHDLRTPISSARLMTEAIEDGVLDDESQRRYITNIKAELNRLDRLMEDLFELSRIDAGALQLHRAPTDVSVLLAESLESVRVEAERAHVRIQSDVQPNLPQAQADPWRLERALRNLLENAVRYTPARGLVALSARAAGDNLELAVADTGPGIADADVARIFEPFFRGDSARTRNGAGAGLGLAIACGIVEAHGGTIALDRDRPQGCTFRISLPLNGSPVTA